MLFILRCIFWLSIVYASMSWTSGALETKAWRTSVADTVAPIAATVETKAVAGAVDYCRRAPAICAAEAARLTALVGASSQDAPDAEAAPVAKEAEVPMPVPDPRRRARGAKTARMP